MNDRRITPITGIQDLARMSKNISRMKNNFGARFVDLVIPSFLMT
jgi:hypothetical protein